jgi:hypothetical protein
MNAASSWTPRPLAASVEELLVGARRIGEHRPDDSRSGALFERVEFDGERCIVKYVHPENDFAMRASGDIGCRPRRVWEAGMMDVAPEAIDHATIGAAPWGRNGWGVALLMRDVSAQLVPVGDDPVPEEQHLRFIDHCTTMAARLWGWRDELELLPHRLRWEWFGPDQLQGERDLGFPEPVPRIATEGWQRFADRAPAGLRAVVDELRRDATPLSEAILETPQTFLHGDWKFGNLGAGDDVGRSCSTGAIPVRGRSVTSSPGTWPSTGRGCRSATRRSRRSPTSKRRCTAMALPPVAGSIVSSACACWVDSSSSDGRRRSVTTPSSAGGAQPRQQEPSCCDGTSAGSAFVIWRPRCRLGARHANPDGSATLIVGARRVRNGVRR